MISKSKGTIAIDFDGVIHKYSQGWKDGSIYDEANMTVLRAMTAWMDNGYAVFIFSTRSPWQIKRWLTPYFGVKYFANEYEKHFTSTARSIKVIHFWTKFWNRTDAIGVTRRKLPALIYVDDRAFKFNGHNIHDVLGILNPKLIVQTVPSGLPVQD